METRLNFEYEISCEHAHSCSMLLANRKFKKDDGWYTWIDYEKFNLLFKKGLPFTSMDYIAKTPDWAVFGNENRGFSPDDTRIYRNKNIEE